MPPNDAVPLSSLLQHDQDASGLLPLAALQRQPSGAEQWQNAIEEQRWRDLWKPSISDQIGMTAQNLGTFLKGGLVGVLRNQGAQFPDWVNRTSDVMTSAPFNAALGVMTPLKGAGIVPATMEKFPVALKPSVSVESAAANLAKAQEFKQKIEALGPQYEVRLDPDSGGSVYANIMRVPLKKDGTPSKAGNPKYSNFKARFADHGSYWGNNVSVDPHSGNTVDRAVDVARYHLTGEGEPPVFGDAKIDPETGEQRAYQVSYNRNAAMNATNPKYPVRDQE